MPIARVVRTAGRMARWRRAAVVAAAAALPAVALAAASSAPCERWDIVGVGPRGVGNGHLHVCSQLLRAVPALEAQVARLNEAAARSDATARQLDGFVGALQGLTRQMRQPDVTRLAASLAERIQRNGRETDARLMREIERLSLGMQDINEKLATAVTDRRLAAAAGAAVAGPAGDAIARLDLDAAMQLLDGIVRIEEKVGRIDQKLDRMQGPYAANPALLRSARDDAERALAQLRQLNGESRCAATWPSVKALYDSAAVAEQQADLNTAGLTYKDVGERAMTMATELSTLDQIVRSQAQATEQVRAQQHALERQTYELARRRYDDRLRNALRFARGDALQRDVAQAQRTAQAAEATAQSGRLYDASDALADAANLLAKVEETGGNYSSQLVRLPKVHRADFTAAMRPMDEAINSVFPNPSCR